MAALREDLIHLIADEALIDPAKLTPKATLADVGLDSVGVISVVFAVEEKYGVEVPEDALRDVTDLDGFLTIIEGLIEARAAA
ncbi:MAG: acyl carrier protein [Alphaproteobacteria bacterium]|nr:acyl carrier protein [Alphaproteobacteria bacterium]